MGSNAAWTGKLGLTASIACAVALGGFWALSASVAGEGDASEFFMFDASEAGAFLGVHIAEEIDHPEGGARITEVVEDSAAERAGLEPGDIIVGVDGDTVRGPAALGRRIDAMEPGDEISLSVVRDGREMDIDVELGEHEGFRFLAPGDDGFVVHMPELRLFGCDEDDEECESSFSWSCSGDDCEDFNLEIGSLFGHRPMLGVQLVHVTEELREHLGSNADEGVLVSKVVAGSAAEEAGIEVGDLIVAVDGEIVSDADNIRRALRDRAGETFDVDVIRDGRALAIGVSLPEPDDDAPSGPRALHFAPRIELDRIQETIDEAMELLHRHLDSSAAVRHEALREMHLERRDAMRDAREALRDARELSLEVRRDSLRKAREAFERSRATANSL